MLQVRDLTKMYGSVQALRGVSFEVQEGDILGFLGPNGAGKSTTMRIVTGYIPASSGTVLVDGLDVLTRSLEARARIGYLAEHTPLYKEMRVREFLLYRAHIKGVPRAQRHSRVAEVMERTELTDRAEQLIDTLSKGYRQRVGIADALVARPRLLILDEPTIGLDPNQVRQVRTLIKDLAAEQTIILSTHILAEVEMICNRVVIIDRGLAIASSEIASLIEKHDDHAIILELEAGSTDRAATIRQELSALDEVSAVQELDELRLRVCPSSTDLDLRPLVFARAAASSWPIVELRREAVRLEDVFVKLTHEAASREEVAL